jgi:SAM-dependent methyltransferase
MNKLSEIVRYLNLLDRPELDPDITAAIKHLYGIVHAVANNRVQMGQVTETMAQDVVDIESYYNKFLATVNGLRDNLLTMVADRQPAMYEESQRLYEQEMIFETAEWILNRKFQSTPDELNELHTRIRNYGDWRLPGLIIRPGLETFVEEMVPLDPLYIVDTMQNLVEPCVNKFNLEYRRRLRVYIVNDYQDPQPLHQLPNNQFGFIYAYNFLNYKPVSVIERYLKEFATKLRPGGHAVFTYNDCDRAQGVGLAESGFMCYTPGAVIRDLVARAGLELEENRLAEYDLSWMDVKKPGDITSYRGAQTLAQIIPK